MFGDNEDIRRINLTMVQLMLIYFFGVGITGAIFTNNLVGALKKTFIRRGIDGIDLLKKNKPIL